MKWQKHTPKNRIGCRIPENSCTLNARNIIIAPMISIQCNDSPSFYFLSNETKWIWIGFSIHSITLYIQNVAYSRILCVSPSLSLTPFRYGWVFLFVNLTWAVDVFPRSRLNYELNEKFIHFFILLRYLYLHRTSYNSYIKFNMYYYYVSI